MLSFFLKILKRKKLEKEGLATSRKRLKQDETFAHAINRSKIVSFIILAVVWLFCAIILIIPENNRPNIYLVVGQIAPKTIYSSLDFMYLNKVATEEKREAALNFISLVFEINDDACKENIEKSGLLLKELETLQKQQENGINNRNIINPSVSPLLIIVQDPKKLEIFRNKLLTVLYRGIISEDQQKLYRDKPIMACIVYNNKKHFRTPQLLSRIPTPQIAAKNFANLISGDYSQRQRKLLQDAIYEFALQFITPNLTFNEELTNLEKKFILSSPKNNVYEDVYKGDLILRKGEIVTKEVLEKLNAYGIEKQKKESYFFFSEKTAYNILISLIMIIITGIYFYHLHPNILQNNQKMGAVGAVIVISVFGIFFAEQIFDLLVSEYNVALVTKSCLIPLGLTAALLSVLVGLRAATFSSLLVSLVAALKLDSYYIVILGMATSCVVSFVVYRAKNYKNYYIRAVTSVSLVFIILELLSQLKNMIQIPQLLGWTIGLSIINGMVTGIISLAVLFILESVFKIGTDMSLLSLCDYNHPLLKKLQLEAPGTYHHSLLVAVLAEQAANAIGANPIRARVCALFHDIGKLAMPEYFTENNVDTSKLHETLKPGLSSMIIMNHVKEGVNLAIKYNLSGIIKDTIEQHHGTDLVYYFYRKAQNKSEDKTGITENEFRYPGPKPQEKEIVLVSLADACEAASRTLVKPNPAKIETMVWEIIRKRIKEGQLDNANLTFQELALAKKCFIKTLDSMLHARINYPTDEEKNESNLFQTNDLSTQNHENEIPEFGDEDRWIS